MRSLQVFMGAYLAGEGWALHLQANEEKPRVNAAASMPGLGWSWRRVLERQRQRALPARAKSA